MTTLLQPLLFEAKVSLEQAQSEGVGIYTKPGLIVLFRADKVALLAPENFKRDRYVVEDAFVGIMELKFNKECNAHEIRLSAANQGYGPLLYEVAMSGRWLMADRLEVSGDAQAVWGKFYNERDDVQIRPLGNECRYGYPPEDAEEDSDNPLNYAYRLKQPLDTARLVQITALGMSAARVRKNLVDTYYKFYQLKKRGEIF